MFFETGAEMGDAVVEGLMHLNDLAQDSQVNNLTQNSQITQNFNA